MSVPNQPTWQQQAPLPTMASHQPPFPLESHITHVGLRLISSRGDLVPFCLHHPSAGPGHIPGSLSVLFITTIRSEVRCPIDSDYVWLDVPPSLKEARAKRGLGIWSSPLGVEEGLCLLHSQAGNHHLQPGEGKPLPNALLPWGRIQVFPGAPGLYNSRLRCNPGRMAGAGTNTPLNDTVR